MTGSGGAGDTSEESGFCVNGGAATISGVKAEDTDDLDETGAVTTGAGAPTAGEEERGAGGWEEGTKGAAAARGTPPANICAYVGLGVDGFVGAADSRPASLAMEPTRVLMAGLTSEAWSCRASSDSVVERNWESCAGSVGLSLSCDAAIARVC